MVQDVLFLKILSVLLSPEISTGQIHLQPIANFTLQKYSVYTGCFIIYSGITKIYYKKTLGHVFTKTVQIEGTSQKKFFHSKLFFIVVHSSAARRCECM